VSLCSSCPAVCATTGRNENPFHCAAKTQCFFGQVLTELGKWSVLIITPIRQCLAEDSKNYPNVISQILADAFWQEIRFLDDMRQQGL